MKPITSKIISKLCKDLVVTSSTSGKVILADTAVKLQQKVHQLSSGTIKYEDGTTQIIDDSKALFIKENFKNNKIAIFYNFIAELEMLKNTIGSKLTTDLEEFNNTDKWIALQIQSGREGVSLAKADALIMFNIQFSAVSYFQSKERLATINRLNNKVYWIFSKGKDSIERRIYDVVKKKKNFTTSIFIKNYNIDKKSLK
jgi:X-X-X-Leu-X-X-Gly heptad repeat protein